MTAVSVCRSPESVRLLLAAQGQDQPGIAELRLALRGADRLAVLRTETNTWVTKVVGGGTTLWCHFDEFEAEACFERCLSDDGGGWTEQPVEVAAAA